MQGVIIKGIGGFYYVLAGERVYECKARGIFRKDRRSPMVGDLVEISVSADDQATVDSILPRLNEFDRPPVSNVQTMVIVSAAIEPEPSLFMIDCFTVAAKALGAEPVLCINKIDLASPSLLRRLSEVYSAVFPLFFVSGKTGEGVESLKEALKGTQAALAGPSGVGKSTLLNRLLGSEKNLTGGLSEKTLRGKHTTRHTELFIEDGMRLFDTPGFTSFELPDMQEEDLQHLFPEFENFAGECRFDDCFHLSEPECSVREAVNAGRIHDSRYRSYVEMMNIIKGRKKY